MRGAICPLRQYVFMAWYLVKHRDNFTFTYLKQYHISRHTVVYLTETHVLKFIKNCLLAYSRDGSGDIAARLRARWPGFDYRRGLRIFLFITTSRPALRPTQPPNQWEPGVLSPGIKRTGAKLTTRLHLAPRIVHGTITSLPHTPSWRGAQLSTGFLHSSL
jgi:hypothetical protein